MDDPKPEEPAGALSELYRFSALGLQFAATILAFAAVGWWLDRKLGTQPWLLIVGVFLGFGLGLYSMILKVPKARPPSRPPHERPR